MPVAQYTGMHPGRRRVLGLFLASHALAGSLASQQTERTGTVRGEIRDSVHAVGLATATVIAVQTAPRRSNVLVQTQSDSQGRFSIDALPEGEYELSVHHPWLDSVGLALPAVVARVRARHETELTLAVPSTRSLLAAMCGDAVPRVPLVGAIAGVVRSAERGTVLPGASVVFMWTDIVVDRRSKQISHNRVVASATADSQGVFRACGIPMLQRVLVQAQADTRRYSGAVDTQVGRAGVLMLTLLVSDGDAVALSTPVTPPSPQVPVETDLQLSSVPVEGYRLVGRVTTEDGEPILNGHVRVLGTDHVGRTTSSGGFRMEGLPGGTQGIEIAALGYYPTRRRVDLTKREQPLHVSLRRMSGWLDTIRVLAERRARPSLTAEFDDRRANGIGRYFTASDILRWNAFFTTDLFQSRLGVRVLGTGHLSRLSAPARGQCVSVYLDRMRLRLDEVNVIGPTALHGIELHTPATAPFPYGREGCRVILLWSKA